MIKKNTESVNTINKVGLKSFYPKAQTKVPTLIMVIATIHEYEYIHLQIALKSNQLQFS